MNANFYQMMQQAIFFEIGWDHQIRVTFYNCKIGNYYNLQYNYYQGSALLMVKIIAPRRTSKNVSVEQYWSIRQKFTNKPQRSEHAYREKDVVNRHRFQRLRDQIQAFNPLSYFLQKQQNFADERKTHTHAYLQSINYRLPEEIMEVKRLMFGLASILQNLNKIYATLCEHLENEDSWKLIQSLLKDTREQSYQYWLDSGIQQIVQNVGQSFKQTQFKQIFLTLCILMNVCFNKITENQQTVFQFINKFSQFYFVHHNKYIRKFSIRCISYILSNLQQQTFHKVISMIIAKQNQCPQIYQFIGDLLSQRLKYSDGCLTPNSIQQLINLVAWLREIEAPSSIYSSFVHKLLSNLQQKNMHQENETLFDFNYIIKAVVQLWKQNKLNQNCFFKGLVQYLEQNINQKGAKKRRLNEQSLSLVSNYLWESLPSLEHEQYIYNILSLSFAVPLTNIANIKNYLSHSSNSQHIVHFLQMIGNQISKDNSMLLLASLSSYLEKYLFNLQQINQTLILIVYKLYLLAKRHEIKINLDRVLNKKMQLKNSITALTKLYNDSSFSKQIQYQYTLVLLRVLLILQLPSTLSSILVQLYNLVMKQYHQALIYYFKLNDPHNPNLFTCNKYVQQIFLYSHTTIPFVWQGFSLLESFIELEKKLGNAIVNRKNESYSLWQRIVINRVSISKQISEMLGNDRHGYLWALQSRHRAIRLLTLEQMQGSIWAQNNALLEMIMQIESEDVDLDTEREVKRKLLDMVRYVQQHQLTSQLNQALLSWSLGFAFTGFKLIEQGFANFVATLIQYQSNIDLSIIISFLSYYTFRNSRVFTKQITQFFNSSQSPITNLELPSAFAELVNQDFNHQQIETIQFIGVDRITLAISKSAKVKSKLGEPLLNLINKYFDVEFVRYKNALINNEGNYLNENGEVNQLLQPPKTTFLKQILKILPSTYQPPRQCLHFTQDYLKLESISAVKRQDWQLMWHKSTKMDHTRVKFQNMSNIQAQLYVHFLWGLLLKADANKSRIIIEYIRDYMNNKVEFFMDIYFNELTLGIKEKAELQRIFSSMDSRKLLTFIYILKASIKALRNYTRDNFDKIFSILIAMIEVLQPPVQQKNMQDEQQDNQIENDEDGNQNQSEEHQHEENEQKSKYKKFKNHRKQIFKILNSLISLLADQIPLVSVDHILQVYDKQNKIANLGKVSINSTPGLLVFIKEVAKHTKYQSLFKKYSIFNQVCHIFKYSHSLINNGPIYLCVNILNDLLNIRNAQQIANQGEQAIQQQLSLATTTSQQLLQSIFIFVNSFGKLSNQIHNQLLRIVEKLIQQSNKINKEWQNYFLLQINKIIGANTLSQINKNKLSLLLTVSLAYNKKIEQNDFLISLLAIIPQLKQIEHRKLIVKQILSSIESGKQQAIGKMSASIVSKLNSTIDGGLVQEIDYPAFFQGVNTFKQHITQFSLHQLQFILYNIIAYLTSTELSVRKSVSTSLQLFLAAADLTKKQLILRIYRILCEQLKKPYNGEDHIFWSIFSCIGYFARWVIQNDIQNAQSYKQLAKYVSFDNKPQNDIFEQFCAISQNKKLDGLRSLKSLFKNQQVNFENKIGHRYPNLLTNVFLPVLEHFILPPQTPNSKFEIAANLTSSLVHVSLQIYEFAMKRGGQSMQKKQLKRMISKLKFKEEHSKRNLVIVKVISQIAQSLSLPKITQTIQKTIKEHGFDEFHKKIVQKQSKFTKIKQDDDESQSEVQIRKKIAFNGYNNEIEDDELINMGYLNLDKKLMIAEEEENKFDEDSFVKFLKMHVLTPLKTMLMFENKSQKNSQQQTDKSRMFLSIVVTKIIMRFPTDIFINELQKILSRLSRLLKKKQIQVRENARKCLAQIAKLVGPNLFYMIFRQMKFHLRDNFQNHIFNYTVYYILQKCDSIQNGSIDHCLPIVLPSIIDEIFGKGSTEKQMVEQNLIPTINMQSKKRKANDLLSITCKAISISKIEYLVKYFEKFLLQYMNSQANVAKYEQMLTNIMGGLNKNDKVLCTQNVNLLIDILHESIEKLKGKIKLYKFDDDGIKHQSTINQQIGQGKKAGKQVLEIQQQAGRNASIFRKQAKQIQQRRNHQILVGCFMQFYLALMSTLIKKKIVDSENTNQKFDSIITFIVECINHRDNRIVHKCLKVIHNVIHWKKMKNIMQIRKKASRKIFDLIEKLTSADEDLLRQCFTLLNDLFEEVSITPEVLHVLVALIKLHITTVERTIAEQPYKLLKTVMIKISSNPKLLFDHAVYELYEFVRATLITTSLDHIRNVCRDICCIYIKQVPQPQEDKHKKQKNKTFAMDLTKQISFYLNNLDCKYSETQLAIIDVIRTYVNYHSKEQLQQTGQVIVMSLGTAYSNDQDNQEKLRETIKLTIQKIDNSKVIGLFEKSLVWAANEDSELITVCGFFILTCILQSKDSTLNSSRKSAISSICMKVLQKQYDSFLIYQSDLKQKAHQAQTLKNNPDWQNIIQTEQVYLKVQKNFNVAIKLFDMILASSKNLQKVQIDMLWKLVASPSQLIHSKIGGLLMKINAISAAVGEKMLSLEKDEEDSIKNKIMNMVRNNNAEYACKLIRKVLQQLANSQQIVNTIQVIILGLLNKVSKSILNLKKKQNQMKLSLQIMQVVLSIDQSICEKIMKNQKIVGEIFWNIAKVNRNQLIDPTIKQKNEGLSQIVKNYLSEAQFYRRLASVEADRKQKRAQDKAQLMKLAITDQQAYGQAKAKKKHKKG